MAFGVRALIGFIDYQGAEAPEEMGRTEGPKKVHDEGRTGKRLIRAYYQLHRLEREIAGEGKM